MSILVDALTTKLQADGYQVTPAPANTTGYTLEVRKGKDCVAVLVKEHKAKVNIAHVQKFQDYLGLEVAKQFTSGWLISASGPSSPALTHVKTEEPKNLRLGTFLDGSLRWEYGDGLTPPPPPPPPIKQKQIRYFGVFTCKGGVGKTTVAAHLAGAFALMGFDVILIDLDPDKNLRKLFLDPNEKEDDGDASLYVPAKGGGEGTTITVLNHDQWNEKDYPNIKIVVCDCSPVLSENPKHLVSKFDYCLIPTTLNPLGVAKKADVITRTFGHIREMNPKAELFAFINGYDAAADAARRNGMLLNLLKSELDKYTSKDSKCKFIHPDDAKIRYSSALFYWGIHIVQGTRPELAFKEVAGRSYPRIDFLQLAEYLEHHTDIDGLKQHEV